MRRVSAATVAIALALIVGLSATGHNALPSWSMYDSDSFQPIQPTQAEQRKASRPESQQPERHQARSSNPTSSPTERPTPAPTGRPAATDRPVETHTGAASTYGTGYDGLFAVPYRSWRGHNVRVCYRGTCLVRRVNDLGPNQRIFPDRVADLDVPTFERLCGCNWRSKGVLRNVTVELLK